MTFHTARAAGSDLWPYTGLSQSLLSLTPSSFMTLQVTAVPDLSLGAGKEHVKQWVFFLALVCAGMQKFADVYEQQWVVRCVTYVHLCVSTFSHIFAPSPWMDFHKWVHKYE